MVLWIKIVQELKRLKCYVYKFLSRDNAVLYIGKTKRLKKRMEKEHFTLNGHLGMDVYEYVDRVIVAEVANSEAMSIYERYLINTERPKYNVVSNKGMDLGFELPELRWVEFDVYKSRNREQLKIKEDKEREDAAYRKGLMYREEVDIQVKESTNERGYRVIRYENTPIWGLKLERKGKSEIPFCRAITVNGSRYFSIDDIENVIYLGRGEEVTKRLIKRGILSFEDLMILEDSTLVSRKHIHKRGILKFGNEKWLAHRVLEQVRLNRRNIGKNAGWNNDLGYLAGVVRRVDI